MKAIYARCSTKKQELDSQLAILRPLYPEALEFVDDGVSGMKREREGIDALLKAVEGGQVDEELGIVEISRLGRSIKQIYDVVERLTQKKVVIRLVKTGTTLNYNSLEGRALLGGLALAAEIEWFLAQERWQRGRATIKREGIKVGPKPKEISELALRSLKERGMSIREIAKEFGVSPATIFRRFKKVGSGNVSGLSEEQAQSEAGSQQKRNAVSGEGDLDVG